MYIDCKKEMFGEKRLLSKKVVPQYIQELYKSGE